MFRYFYSSLFAKLFATSCSILVGIASLKLIETYLAVPEFGVMAVALQILSYLPLIDGGVRAAANYRILSADSESSRNRLYAFCQKFYSWFGLGVTLVTTLAMMLYFMSDNVRASGYPLVFFVAIAWVTALSHFVIAQGTMLIALQSQHLAYWWQGVGSILNLSVLALGLGLGLKLWAFPLSSAVSMLCIWPAFVFQLRKKVPGFKVLDFRINSDFKADVKQLGRQSFYAFRTQLAVLLLFSLELVLVGFAFGFREAAIYALFLRVFTILRSLMQSAGEVSWPVWAQGKGGGKESSYILLKGNAWLYGSLAGALSFSLIPFLQWFMGPEWTGSASLMGIMLFRFVVAGISNPAGYFLIGRGEFRSLARVLERELIAAIILSFCLLRLGPQGIALGFLLATVFGTGFPILRQYARAAEQRLGLVMASLWFRAAAGFVASLGVTGALVKLWSNQWAIFGGAAGTFTGVAVAALFAYFQWLWSRSAVPSGFNFRALVNKL